ncbi:hypothetical protein ACOV5J_02930 [Weissella soli]|uniref:hypothetical protein n=1 Tax=Weissella soli TaxID=155866 RepID=UPI003C767B91
MFFEKLVSVLVVLFGIFLYITGITLNIDSLLFDSAAGADVITGVVLLDGMSRGWLL